MQTISVALWRERGFALEAIPVPRLSQGFLSFLAGIAVTSTDLPARVRAVQSGFSASDHRAFPNPSVRVPMLVTFTGNACNFYREKDVATAAHARRTVR